MPYEVEFGEYGHYLLEGFLDDEDAFKTTLRVRRNRPQAFGGQGNIRQIALASRSTPGLPPSQSSSTSPLAVMSVAMRAAAGPRARFRSTSSACSWRVNSSGLECSPRRDSREQPSRAVIDGCGVDTQSMRNGTSPSPASSSGKVSRQSSRPPSGSSRPNLMTLPGS